MQTTITHLSDKLAHALARYASRALRAGLSVEVYPDGDWFFVDKPLVIQPSDFLSETSAVRRAKRLIKVIERAIDADHSSIQSTGGRHWDNAPFYVEARTAARGAVYAKATPMPDGSIKSDGFGINDIF